MILSCTDLGGFNNEGTRLKQPGWLRDCMKDKRSEQLPNYIIFWRSKNWAFVVLRPWDFRVNLVPQHNLANPNTVTWLLWLPIRILQNKGNLFNILLRSHPPLKLDTLTVYSLSFSLQWETEAQKYSVLCPGLQSMPTEKLKFVFLKPLVYYLEISWEPYSARFDMENQVKKHF